MVRNKHCKAHLRRGLPTAMKYLFVWLAFCSSAFALPSAFQSPLAALSAFEESDVPYNASEGLPTDGKPLRIAIIGSGITGAAAAYNIYEQSRTKRTPQPAITVFERNPIIGGRFTQAYAFNDPRYPVDTCAATFSLGDQCILASATGVGLMTMPAPVPMRAGTGVWDGKLFVGFVEADGFRTPLAWSFFRKLKWFQRYGATPTRLANNATTARQQLFQLLPLVAAPMPGVQAKKNLRQEVAASGLLPIVEGTLCSLGDPSAGIDCAGGKERLFVEEVCNAGARERYLGNLGQQSAIVGGNLRLIDRLLALSRATIRLNTTVRSLEGDEGSASWLLDSVDKPEGPGRPGTSSRDEFEIVILASSLSLANVTFTPKLARQPGLQQLYTDSYVTHCTTSRTLNGSTFGRPVGMPQNVLTSPALRAPYTEPPFFSLTLVKQILRTDSQGRPMQPQQNLYKLVSRGGLSDDVIASYVARDMLQEGGTSEAPLITWIDRQRLPASVLTIDDFDELLEGIEIAPGVIYAGGGE
ncbi:hypothetical protein LTR85_007590 [Meristemomyces frigidus]|nr:hypothetical protein LTR85_007590 [Meristemomyces frigidus]